MIEIQNIEVPELNMFVVGDLIPQDPSFIVRGFHFSCLFFFLDLAALQSLSVTQKIGTELEVLSITSLTLQNNQF